MAYKEYLKSNNWREKRKSVLKRDGYRCRICGSRKNLQVHHLAYKNIYKEKMEDLITVCSFHHLYYYHQNKTFFKYINILEKITYLLLFISFLYLFKCFSCIITT